MPLPPPSELATLRAARPCLVLPTEAFTDVVTPGLARLRLEQQLAGGAPASRWDRMARRAIVALQDHGIAVDPSPIGEGIYGCAYPVQDDANIVVKITSDETEALASQVAASLDTEDVPALAKTSCVYGFRGLGLFAIVQERVFPLSDADRDFLGPLLPQTLGRIAKDWTTWLLHPETLGLLDNAEQALGPAGRWNLRRLLRTLATLHRVDLGDAVPTVADVLRDRQGGWRIVDLGPRGVIPALLPRDLAARVPVLDPESL